MKTARIYGHLHRTGEIRTVMLLPRLRLTLGAHVGLGFEWITVWLHVWLWENASRHDCWQLELLPHLWLHWHPTRGSGMHVGWLRWRWHCWFREGARAV